MKKETAKAAPKSPTKKVAAKKTTKTVKKLSTPQKSVSKTAIGTAKNPSRVKKTVKPVPIQQPQTQISHRRPLLIIPK